MRLIWAKVWLLKDVELAGRDKSFAEMSRHVV
jgi:hypothetical protein